MNARTSTPAAGAVPVCSGPLRYWSGPRSRSESRLDEASSVASTALFMPLTPNGYTSAPWPTIP